jgi:selenocysteine lyase/cysteine desulfurase
MAAAGVHAAVMGPRVWVSPHLWTTRRDLDRLVGALAGAIDAVG